MMVGCALVPAYDASRSVGEVIRSLVSLWPEAGAVIVVDDGSRDDTAAEAERAGARVVRHSTNRGKGAALRTGLRAAHEAGFDVAVTVDADGQHPPAEALALLRHPASPGALVLGIRDLVKAGAPRPNQLSNRISNFFLSTFARTPFADTQCGLRRYPIAATLAADGGADGYAFEAEIILRLLASGTPVIEAPIDVIYPPEEERITHFHSVRDPARIIGRVVATLFETRYMTRAPRQIAVPSRPARRDPAPARVSLADSAASQA
ncbi:MAG: glycosyltransferase family 2 protein [Polyangiaceae bacterium]